MAVWCRIPDQETTNRTKLYQPHRRQHDFRKIEHQCTHTKYSNATFTLHYTMTCSLHVCMAAGPFSSLCSWCNLSMIQHCPVSRPC